MINAFTVKNYKCHTNTELPTLSRVTLIGGSNNAGKTALLEALFLYHDRLNPNLSVRHAGWRGINSLELRPEMFFSPLFSRYDTESVIQLNAISDGCGQVMSIRYVADYQPAMLPAADPAHPGARAIRADQPAVSSAALHIQCTWSGSPSVDSHLMVYQDGARLALGTGGHSVGPARFLAARGFIDPGEVAAMYGDLDVRGNAGIVEQFLHVLDPGVKGLSLVPIAGVSVVHADLGLPRKVPVAFAGGGMARLLEMAVAIGASRGGVVLIDEVENGLHHDSLPDVWRAVAQAARDCDCQVVATTHSYECVRAAHEAFSGEWAEDLTYLRLERVRGSVTARVADHATLGAALDGGLEVR